MNNKSGKDIWQHLQVFKFKDQSEDILIVKYNLTDNIHDKCIILLLVGDNHYVLADSNLIKMHSADFRKVNIAFNIALPHKIENDDKNSRIEFTRIYTENNLNYPVCQKIIEIINQINTNNNETKNL